VPLLAKIVRGFRSGLNGGNGVSRRGGEGKEKKGSSYQHSYLALFVCRLLRLPRHPDPKTVQAVAGDGGKKNYLPEEDVWATRSCHKHRRVGVAGGKIRREEGGEALQRGCRDYNRSLSTSILEPNVAVS